MTIVRRPPPLLIDTNIHVTTPHVPPVDTVAHRVSLFDIHGTTPMGTHVHKSSLPSFVPLSTRVPTVPFPPNSFGMPTSMAAHMIVPQVNLPKLIMGRNSMAI